MSDRSGRQGGERKYDFQSFPENVQLVNDIERRLARRAPARADGPAVVREIADLQRYMTELYDDVRFGSREVVAEDCVNVAAAAFVISRLMDPDYYMAATESEPAMFVKKMGDAMALNEVDIDLGSGRWSASADLIMDMLSALSVVTGTLAIEAEGTEGYAPSDLDFNALAGCALIAAYALVISQCAKNGSYRGQTLKDLPPGKP